MSLSLPMPIAMDTFLTHCMGNLEFAQSLLSVFENDLPGYADQIVLKAREGNAKTLAEAAHALKGTAGIIAAEPLRLLAKTIESAGKAGDLTEVTSLVKQLDSEVQRCLKAIPELRERLISSSSNCRDNP
jgi:HPt (histidine-containing phosphotransfer) domain-containing protein